MRYMIVIFSIFSCVARLHASYHESIRAPLPLARSSSTPDLNRWMGDSENVPLKSDKPSQCAQNEKSPVMQREAFVVTPKKTTSLPYMLGPAAVDGKRTLAVRVQPVSSDNPSGNSSGSDVEELINQIKLADLPSLNRKIQKLEKKVKEAGQKTEEVHKEVTGTVSPRLQSLHNVQTKMSGDTKASVVNSQLTVGKIDKAQNQLLQNLESIKSDLTNIKIILELIGKTNSTSMAGISDKISLYQLYFQELNEKISDTQASSILAAQYAEKALKQTQSHEEKLVRIELLLQSVFNQGDETKKGVQKITNALVALAQEEGVSITHETAKKDS